LAALAESGAFIGRERTMWEPAAKAAGMYKEQ